MKNAILLFLIAIQCCIAQPKKLGETEKALETSKTFLGKLQFDSAYVYADKALWLANQSKDRKLQISANLSVAEALYRQDKKVGAIPFAEKSLQFAKETNDNDGIMKAWLMLGDIHQAQLEADQSIAYYQKIDAFATSNKILNATLVKSITSMGLLFFGGYEDGKPPMESAEACFRRAYAIANKINAKTEAYIAARHLAAALISKKEPDYKKAIALYTNAYNHFKNTGDLPELTITNEAFAALYRQMGKSKVAEKFYQDNIVRNDVPNNITGSAHAYWQLASFFYANGQYQKAIPVYQTAIRLFKMQPSPEIGPMSMCMFEVSESFAKTGNMKRAYDYLRVYKTYNDSVQMRENESDFTTIEGRYQMQKKETESKLLSVQNEMVKQQRIKYLFLFLGIMVLVAMGIVIVYNGNKNKVRSAQKWREINEVKSQFFATISREFRAPLASIKSPIQSLQVSQIDENQKRQLLLIDKNADRMLELTNQLLEISRIDSGNFKLNFKEGKPDALLEAIIEPFALQAKESGIPFISNIEKTSSSYFFDPEAIEKIATYLLSNAFKHTSQKQPVYFSGTIEDRQLLLRISNGSEYKKEDLPQLFERFYQKNESQDSSGIGLALVKELVELYKGSIETALDGNMLRFLIKLPLDVNNTNGIAAEASSPVIALPKPETAPIPVLLVMDAHTEMRKNTCALFAKEYKILEASDGDHALKMARKEIPDCIISDIMLPEMHGLAFIHAIKNDVLTSFIPLILLSEKSGNTTHSEALKSAADAFLTKPVNPEILKTTVAQLIAERHKWQDRYSKEWVLKPVDIAINPVDEKFADKLQQVLDKELANSDCSPDDFAHELGMSRIQLQRKLKTLIGVSATELLRNERLKAAAELLKKRDGDVSEIAYAVGFNDISYFSKCFKERYHILPSEYAKGL